jgi:bacterioferritin-associated ferredoxin
MYVCLCNNIREQDLRRAAEAGVSDVLSAYELLGVAPCCGQCLGAAESLLRAHAGDGRDQSSAALCSWT